MNGCYGCLKGDPPQELKKNLTPSMKNLPLTFYVSSQFFSQLYVPLLFIVNFNKKKITFPDFKPRDLRFIARKMSQLEKLELQICPKNLKKGLTRPIEFKFLKHLVLTIFDIHVTVENFPLVCDKLEKLEVHCCAWQDVWFNFAHQNKLTTLTLLQLFGVIGGHGPPKEFLMKVAKNWPNLTDARVQVDDLSSNEIARFIMECKNLQRMEISDASPRWSEKCNEVTSKLRNEWKSVPSTEEKKYLIIRK